MAATGPLDGPDPPRMPTGGWADGAWPARIGLAVKRMF